MGALLLPTFLGSGTCFVSSLVPSKLPDTHTALSVFCLDRARLYIYLSATHKFLSQPAAAASFVL